MTGLTLEQAFTFDMVLTWRDIQTSQRASVQFVRKHIEDEHKGDDWKPE